jgi:hypothetical protein
MDADAAEGLTVPRPKATPKGESDLRRRPNETPKGQPHLKRDQISHNSYLFVIKNALANRKP